MSLWESHPTWVRGLKQSIIEITKNNIDVAPYVGAWIETGRFRRRKNFAYVAPYVGAWIETGFNSSKCLSG